MRLNEVLYLIPENKLKDIFGLLADIESACHLSEDTKLRHANINSHMRQMRADLKVTINSLLESEEIIQLNLRQTIS